jgi:hypothetical protein
MALDTDDQEYLIFVGWTAVQYGSSTTRTQSHWSVIY